MSTGLATFSEEHEMLRDWFTTAFEGGIGYWARAETYRWDVADPAEVQAVIVPADAEDDEFERTTVTLATIKDGLVKIAAGETTAPHRLVGLCTVILREIGRGTRWLDLDEASDFDADDADAVVQIAVLGSLVYG